MSRATYRVFTTPPEKVAPKPELDDHGITLGWSGGNMPVPAIGDIVKARINRIGAVEIVSYFCEDGWLGVLARPLNPPEWYIRQNGRDATCHLFGCEVDPLPLEPK